MQVQLGNTDEKQFVLLSLLDAYPFVSPGHDTSTVGRQPKDFSEVNTSYGKLRLSHCGSQSFGSAIGSRTVKMPRNTVVGCSFFTILK